MPCYVSEQMTTAALSKMKCFYYQLRDLYSTNGLDVNGDMGRRNMLMSSLQEKFFAEELQTVYPQTVSDGKTGEPDIIIPEINGELECKLTSKNRSGSWALQTDYNTLSKKGSLDYLYVLASDNFEEFAVLFFEKLTCDDFHPPASGSKGKSRMNMANAMKKCTVIHGLVNDNATEYTAAAQAIVDNPNATQSQIAKAISRLDYWSGKTNITFALEAA
jgi:hypothetical protein